MSIFKCKMCGGALEIGENQSVATCEYCGTQQTLPKLDNEKKLALFSRANNLRIKSEFDKAAGIYESIIAEFRDEAEAYWGLVLCKYGIEYVDDGKGKRVPTCHRTLPVAIMEDDDFQQACENADITAKNIYRHEAKAIDKIQKKILNIALNEEPYDIFICYKETDDITGSRTEDSLIAQDIYTQLLKDGYRVFFSRVSLRQVAGTEYEPYIYAALSSAKIMLAIGTKHDYYDAVWVKNEWSRFISMMSDDSTKVLIPCFKNMDAYDMPKEFKNMQALDMGDVTFFGSLTESIERIIDKTRGKAPKETIILNNDNVDVAPLLERGFLILEDKDWNKADELFEAVLNKDPKNAQAYLGKLLVDLEVSRFEALSDFHTSFSDNNNYEKIMRFAGNQLKQSVKKCNDIIVRRNEEQRKKDIYENALEMMEHATTEEMFENAGYMFQEVKDYADAKAKSEECFEKGEIARLDAILYKAKDLMKGYNNISNYETAIKLLEEIPGWKDADEQIPVCRKRIEEINAKEEADRIERERKAEEERLERERKAEIARNGAEKRAKILKTIGISLTVVVVSIFALVTFKAVNEKIIVPNKKYDEAVSLMKAEKYDEAIAIFTSINGFSDSFTKIDECTYKKASSLMNEKKYDEAITIFTTISGFSDSPTKINECNYNKAVDFLEAGNTDEAYKYFVKAGNYSDTIEQLSPIAYSRGVKLLDEDKIVEAMGCFVNSHGYKDSKSYLVNWNATTLSHYVNHTVGLKNDGTVVAVGNNGNGECDVSNWNDIVSVSTGGGFTIGLKPEGTVVVSEWAKYNLNGIENWTDIVAISTGKNHAVGLKSDGSVVATGNGGCDVSNWTDIVAISARDYGTVGLKSDGTVVADGYDTEELSKWTDIVAISAGCNHVVGLKSNGTVVVSGDAFSKEEISNWTDIVAISAGDGHTAGLKSNGKVVVSSGSFDSTSPLDITGWNNITAISFGYHGAVLLKSNGTVVANGLDLYTGTYDVSDWTDIKQPTKY